MTGEFLQSHRSSHPRLQKLPNGNWKPIPGPNEVRGVNLPNGLIYIFLRFLSFLGELGLGNLLCRWGSRFQSIDRPTKFSKNYKPMSGDVFICSFAKCGFHWIGQTALQIAWRGRLDYDHIHQAIPWIELPFPSWSPATVNDPIRSPIEGIQVIKSHLKKCDLPYNSAAKYIVVVRDPCDAVASGYPFAMGNINAIIKGRVTPQEWLQSYLDNQFLFGSWAEHVAGFWQIRDRSNVLFLNFSEMKKEPEIMIDKMAKFMGVVLTDEERALVVKKSTFSWMKENNDAFRAIVPVIRSNASLSPTIRKGKDGGAGELYTKQEQASIERHSRLQLAKLGCDIPYDKMFRSVQYQ